ncbi:unnamed protein product [marine sediment metagenome]|uniref:Uncharacterized protein n=1 Tax=marine sediment metagenome TaxID=412755 RepID=X1CMF4_9ZZZZ
MPVKDTAKGAIPDEGEALTEASRGGMLSAALIFTEADASLAKLSVTVKRTVKLPAVV